MSPAYHNLQLVILDKHVKELEHLDVVAFRSEALSSVMVKRIVGCPGDTVQIIGGKLYVNGELNEFYCAAVFDYSGELEQKIILATDEYIVIGDNVSESKDSRYSQVGVVNRDCILGKVI